MVTLAVGATGTAGTALTVSGVALETQVLSVVDRSVTLCNPGATPVNVAEAWNAPPSRLYSYDPLGAVMTMVPIEIEHVRKMVTLAVGATCTAGPALTVSRVALKTPVLSVVARSVTLCYPGATPVNVAEAWNAPPSRLYSYAPVGAVMTMVPVGIAHVG